MKLISLFFPCGFFACLSLHYKLSSTSVSITSTDFDLSYMAMLSLCFLVQGLLCLDIVHFILILLSLTLHCMTTACIYFPANLPAWIITCLQLSLSASPPTFNAPSLVYEVSPISDLMHSPFTMPLLVC